MQKWLISADTKEHDIESYIEEDGLINWRQYGNYELGDIIYIYAKVPVGKVLFKTVVVEKSLYYEQEDYKYARLSIIEKVDSEGLSLENLRCHGLTTPPMGAMRLKDDLEEYIDKFFNSDENYKVWYIKAGEKAVKLDEFKENNFVAIGWDLGDISGKTKNQIKELCNEYYPNNSSKTINNYTHQINAFVNDINVGDYIFSSNREKTEFYLGIITSDYYFSDKKDNNNDLKYKHCRDVKWLSTIKDKDLSPELIKSLPPHWSVIDINYKLKKEFLEFFKFIPYPGEEKRNMIYFGAPGTGKSYNLNKNKETLLYPYENNYERVTFHPDYTYGNFVGTYKPTVKNNGKSDSINDGEITYKYAPGPFMRILVKALKNPSQPFLLIIEEINRANVAAVFGDVFQLLDRENNISEYPIAVSEDMQNYLKEELKISEIPDNMKCFLKKHWVNMLGENFDKIIIPANMFIWATMNSADQGVFPMDTAFKRRWDFNYLGINDGVKIIENLKFELYGKKFLWNDLRTAINKKLLSYGINEDKLIGPFFAFNEFIDDEFIPEDKFKYIFKNKIIMYLFEDAARSRRDKLFSGIENNENIIYSDICNNFDNEEIGLKIFNKSITSEFFKNSE